MYTTMECADPAARSAAFEACGGAKYEAMYMAPYEAAHEAAYQACGECGMHPAIRKPCLKESSRPPPQCKGIPSTTSFRAGRRLSALWQTRGPVIGVDVGSRRAGEGVPQGSRPMWLAKPPSPRWGIGRLWLRKPPEWG
jgi:hypothetical protein